MFLDHGTLYTALATEKTIPVRFDCVEFPKDDPTALAWSGKKRRSKAGFTFIKNTDDTWSYEIGNTVYTVDNEGYYHSSGAQPGWKQQNSFGLSFANFNHGFLHGYSFFTLSNKLQTSFYHKDGLLHSYDSKEYEPGNIDPWQDTCLPAIMSVTENKIMRRTWYYKGRPHRRNGPAIIFGEDEWDGLVQVNRGNYNINRFYVNGKGFKDLNLDFIKALAWFDYDEKTKTTLESSFDDYII